MKEIWKDIKEPEQPTYKAYYTTDNTSYTSGINFPASKYYDLYTSTSF